MFDDLWEIFEKHISIQRTKDYAIALWNKQKWFSAEKDAEAIQWYLSKIDELGLKQIENLNFPADNKTSFGGIVIPKLWNVNYAVLEILSPVRAEIADYSKNPSHLMLYAAATNPNGLEFSVGRENEISVDKAVFGRINPDEGHDLIIKNKIRILISDFIRQPEAAAKDAIHWTNFTINPFYAENITGFSISQDWGDKIRKWLAEGKEIKFRAQVDTTLTDGSLEIPTAVIPGKNKEEILLTGHLYEMGLADNASGCGLGIEIMGVISDLIDKGILPKPNRTIRLIPSFESRALQAYTYQYPDRKAVAALCLDYVASDNTRTISLFKTPFSNPSIVDYLLLSLLEKASKLYGSNYTTCPFWINDTQLSDPVIGVPTPSLSVLDDRDHFIHNSLDNPSNICFEATKIIGVIAATYVYFLANASTKDFYNLGCVANDWLKINGATKFHLNKIDESLTTLAELSGESVLTYCFQELAKDVLIHEPKQVEVPVQLSKEAESMVPIRHYKGFIGFDDLSDTQLYHYFQQFGRYPDWISPVWLNQALFLADGKMSVYQIYQVLSGEGMELELKDLLKYIQFLDKIGKLSIKST